MKKIMFALTAAAVLMTVFTGCEKKAAKAADDSSDEILYAVTAKKLLGEGVWQSLTEIAVCLTCSGITIYFLGMTKTEKRHFVEMIFKFLKKQMK